MNHDAEKLWFSRSLNQVAVNRTADAITAAGKAFPCRVVAVAGSLVTVAFEADLSPATPPQITIPKAEGPWIRSPTQVGDYGLTVPADVFISHISGQGGGTPGLQRPGNLAALVWVPVASKTFGAVNTNAAYVSGPQGAVIETSDGNTVITVAESGVTIKVGGKTWTFTAAGLTISTGVVLETHVHSGVQTGGSDTGPPV
ncbi:MAG: hypothetical protein B7X10_01600 [Burkholderiales bacterium 21-58-4]|nr:MAG: hypothetical protein B7X10_01600 [Burkholderiales bacterium 21-58-4]